MEAEYSLAMYLCKDELNKARNKYEENMVASEVNWSDGAERHRFLRRILIKKNEVEYWIRMMKTKSVQGPDGILPIMLKKGCKHLALPPNRSK